MTWIDDDYDPEWDEAAQRRAEEPPDWYLEQEAERQAQLHRDQEHFGEECNCPPRQPPPCRVLFRVPRWWPGKGWRCGTPGGCDTPRYRSPLAARRAHRCQHEPPF